MSERDDVDVTGKAVWLGASDTAAAVTPTGNAPPTGVLYQGPDCVIEVSVTGERKGEVSVHHIVLVHGSAPQFITGVPPAPPLASLELSGKDARAQQEGRLAPVVGYMRGTTKTKGATRPLYEFFRSLDQRIH